MLVEGTEYSTFLEWDRASVFAVMAPVFYEDRVDGAIITCHRTVRKTVPAEKKGRERVPQECPADRGPWQPLTSLPFSLPLFTGSVWIL